MVSCPPIEKEGGLMSVGLGLLSKCIKDQVPIEFFTEHNLNQKTFKNEEKEVFQFLESHFKEYSKMPDLETVERATGIALSAFPDEPMGYWLDGVEDRTTSFILTDAADLIREGVRAGDIEEAVGAAKKLYRDIEQNQSNNNLIPRSISAAELAKMEFKEIRWTIPDILPEGLSILAGKPKIGKSIFSYNICFDASLGAEALGKIPTKKSKVLYCALEDNLRRLETRMRTMQRTHQQPGDNLYFLTEIERMGSGGLARLEREIKRIEPQLAVIDTLAQFRPATSRRNSTAYDTDYQTISAVKAIADKHSIAILIVHHQRKMSADDIFDTLSGTLGLTGAADTLLVLARTGSGQADAELHVTGRDIESNSFALRFDQSLLRWDLIGKADEVKATQQQQAVLNCLKEADEPLSPKEIAELTGQQTSYVKKTLPKLLKAGNIQKEGYGKYIYNNK